jgi:hypothetical protein
MLAVNAIFSNGWDRLINAIPPHCVTVIANLADTYAKTWERFGIELAQRRSTVVH